ncbi:MAG: hypothetical protein V1773_17130 [bacterium]
MSDDKKIELLKDHYNDTFSEIKDKINNRNKMFLLLLVFCALILFKIYSLDNFNIIIPEIVSKKLGITKGVNSFFINSILWFAILAASTKYFQYVINIERLYNYIHKQEVLLAKEFDNKSFNREGASYLNKYPVFSDWISFTYKIIFPVCFILLILSNLWNDFNSATKDNFLFVINSIFCFYILISCSLYLIFLYKKNK